MVSLQGKLCPFRPKFKKTLDLLALELGGIT